MGRIRKKQIQQYRYIQMFSKNPHAYRAHAHAVPVKDLPFYLYHLYLYGQWTVMDSSFLKSLTGTARTCGTRDKFLDFTVHYCPLSRYKQTLIRTEILMLVTNKMKLGSEMIPKSKIIPEMLGSFGNFAYLCRRSGKDPFSRRSVMYQPCEWKPEKLSFLTSKRAQRLPRYMRGALPQFLVKGFLRTSIRNWQRQSRASAMCET